MEYPKGKNYHNEYILIRCPFCNKIHKHQYLGVTSTPCGKLYHIRVDNVALGNIINTNEDIINNRLEAI